MLCAVDVEFIADDFNLKGLSKYVHDLSETILTILDASDSYEDCLEYNHQHTQTQTQVHTDQSLKQDAALLYGLIHARYIMTAKGIATMVS
jgi:casein kinase II subunit beta